MPAESGPARGGRDLDRGTTYALGTTDGPVCTAHGDHTGVEPVTSFDIRLQRVIDATPDAAFHHWVDADARRNWYAPEEGWIVEAQTDLRVGGAWSVSFGPTPDEMYHDEGVFEVVEPPHRLVYTAVMRFPGRDSFETRISVTFQETPDGKTLMTLFDRGYPSKERRDEHERGWPAFLDAFERTLAPFTRQD